MAALAQRDTQYAIRGSATLQRRSARIAARCAAAVQIKRVLSAKSAASRSKSSIINGKKSL
jgi:hypothetical protein